MTQSNDNVTMNKGFSDKIDKFNWVLLIRSLIIITIALMIFFLYIKSTGVEENKYKKSKGNCETYECLYENYTTVSNNFLLNVWNRIR